MIESIDNFIQLFVLGACAGISIHKALMSRKQEWTMLALFFSCFFMGNLYWQLFLLYYGETPTIFYVADLSWYVGDFFLFQLLRIISSSHPSDKETLSSKLPHVIKWGIIIFVSGMCVFFMQWGDYVSNIVAAILMGLIAVQAVRGGWYAAEPSYRRIYRQALFFVVCEYAVWIGSCFLEGESLANPYYWFDGALTISYLLILIAALKELRVDRVDRREENK